MEGSRWDHTNAIITSGKYGQAGREIAGVNQTNVCLRVESCIMAVRAHAQAAHKRDARQWPIQDKRCLSGNKRQAGAR